MIRFQVNRLQRGVVGRISRIRDEWAVRLLAIARVIVIGVAYLTVRNIPGLTSSFVAIFTALLTFDLLVAAPSLRPRQVDYSAFLVRTRQALSQTVASLAKGLSVGLLFGSLTLAGFSDSLGAILTVGLGYTWANRARRSFTSFVGLLGGLYIFEQIRVIEDVDSVLSIITHVAPVAWRVSSGTVTALLSGWIMGIPVGLVTRLLLARPYRSRGSQAYDPPFEVRPFEEVVHAGQGYRLFQVRVEPGAPIEGALLADLGWRDAHLATIVAIERPQGSVPMPRGQDRIQSGDVLLVLSPTGEVDRLTELAKPLAKGV